MMGDYTPPRFLIHGPKGYLRTLFLTRGRAYAVLDELYTESRADAVRLCSREAATHVLSAIKAHHPFTDPGLHIVELMPECTGNCRQGRDCRCGS